MSGSSGTARAIAYLLGLEFQDGQPANSIGPVRFRDLTQTMSVRTPAIRVTDPEYGAVGDWNGTTGTDDSAAFNAALLAAGEDGLVIVPPAPGGNAYLWNNPVASYGTSMIGLGGPRIIYSNANTALDAFTFWGSANPSLNSTQIIEGFYISGDPNTPTNRGQDLFRYSGGIRSVVRNVTLYYAGRDGFHVEAGVALAYTESLVLDTCYTAGAGRDGFHFETGNTAGIDYINVTTLINPHVRFPTRYSLAIVVNGGDANSKVSALTCINGEFDCSGSSAIDGCIFNGTVAGAQMEAFGFYQTTFEDSTNGHAASGGWNIAVPGTSVNGITLDQPVFYGVQNVGMQGYVPGGLSTANFLFGPNLAINGEMDIDQRGEGASVAVPTGSYVFVADRTLMLYTGSATGITAQRVTDAPPGFLHSVKVTIATGNATVAAFDRFQILIPMEGIDTAMLGYGTAAPLSVSVMFWVKTSYAGNYALELHNSAEDWTSVCAFTVNSANAWQLVTIADIFGPTAGTWLTGEGQVGIYAAITLMSGASLQSPGGQGTWNNYQAAAFAGARNLTTITAATFQLSGFALVPGSNIGLFPGRPFQQRLALCQRDYEKSYANGVAKGTVTTANALIVSPGTLAAFTPGIDVRFKVTKCLAPTMAWYSPGTGTVARLRDITGAADVVATTEYAGTNGASVLAASATYTNHIITAHFTADTGFS